MRISFFACIAVLLSGGFTFAGDITIDFNGFLNRRGGQVTVTGWEKPVRWEAGAAKFVLKDVPAGARCGVDFFHNAGEGSSDFSFVMNDAGTGVAAVGLGGGVHEMLVDFEPGDDTLTLRAFDIVYNANEGQTGEYFIAGLIDPHSLRAGSGPQTLRAVPGTYSVDNLYNAGAGNEDFHFMVDDQGNTSGVVETVRVYTGQPREEIVDRRWQRDGNEYATYDGPNVNPRYAIVRFTITGTGRLLDHPTHQRIGTQREGGEITYDMPVTIGAGGMNLSSFGKYTIHNSNVIEPDGQPAEGRSGDNDYVFTPRLRYSEDEGFYFETTAGPSRTARGEATGYYDGNERPLSATVKAEIVKPAKATTQPAAP